MNTAVYRNALFSVVALLLAACAGTNTPTTYSQCNPLPGHYCVQTGDTLYRLSQRFGVSVTELKRLNQLSDNTIHVNQRLKIQQNTSVGKTTIQTPTTLQWPLKGNILKPYSSNNLGIDIAAPAGSVVVAAADGVVMYAGSDVRGYGQLLLVRHSNNLLTAYANNERLLVGEKTQVKAGQAIATVGHSGRLDGETALHFEVRLNGKAVNPMPYLH